MNLLFVTDNSFYRTACGVFDSSCYGQEFFADYRAVFESVSVAARIRYQNPPDGAARADSPRVAFIDLRDVHRARWALAPMSLYCQALPSAVRSSDALCVRIPSVSGIFASRLARRYSRPLMFEHIGDPIRQIGSFGLAARLFSYYLAASTTRIIRQAVVGSYVSRQHLQERYPPRPHTVTDSISSIRLPEAAIQPPKTFNSPPIPLRIVLTASLLPYKDHDTLLRGFSLTLRAGLRAELHLLGDGPLRSTLMALATSLGCSSAVFFHGHITDRNTIFNRLRASDLFVMPSIGEGLPRAMIEAMAAGIPAVGSDTPALREILPASQRFRVRDPDGLAQVLLRAAREPELLTTWAALGYETARQFSDTVLSPKRRKLLAILKNKARADS